MRARTLGSLLVTTALILPAPAAAHELPNQPLTAAERHRAADLAGVSVPTLERRVRTLTRRLGRQPGTRVAAARVATGDPGLVGSWSQVIPAPVVPIFEALLPNGKILMWDSVRDAPAESYPDHTSTRAAVYDPKTNTSKRVDVAGSNLFCAGFVQLANGNVFVAGGNADSALHGSRHTHVFDWRSESWSNGPDMQDGRWYPSVASMPSDEALIIGGGPTVAEIRTTSGGLRRLPNVVTPTSREYPFFQSAPDGRALLLGPTRGLSLIDTGGLGTLTPFADRDAITRSYGGYAPYDIGRFLVAGGGAVTEDGLSNVPTRTATTVDTRSGTPLAAPTGSMNRRRRQHTLTVLADGSVLATGGLSTMGGGGFVDLANAVYQAERWNPATGTWTELAPAAVARQYHSTAMLLPDGRVLTGGGGICGVCQQVGYLRRDQEIFTPPYLYRQDGSRPTRRAPADQRRAERDRLCRRVRADLTAGGEHQEGRARAARRADPLRGPEPALRAARLLRRRDDADGGRAQQPQRGAGGPLHAVRGRLRRRSLGEHDRRAGSHGRLHAGARQPRAQPAGDQQHAVRDDGGPREGAQRQRVGRQVRQVLHEGGRPLAGGRPRLEPDGQHLRRPALRSRRRARRVQHARLPLRDAHGRRDSGARR